MISPSRRLCLLLCLGGALFFHGCATPPPAAAHLVKPQVLPLALSDAFAFKKTKLYYNGPGQPATTNEMLNFQQRRIAYGAIDSQDGLERQGNYFTFFWKAERRADLTLRLEYRTQLLADYVQAREISYRQVKGTHQTQFRVVGNDYVDDGRVTSYRALLIEDGKIVAMDQSLLWN